MELIKDNKNFFRNRTLSLGAMVVGFFALSMLAGNYVGFDFLSSALELPYGFVWMAENFVPEESSFGRLGQILTALGSTIMVSIASSTIAAIVAFPFAVIGSQSVGLGGVTSTIVRGIASLFRNIPVVAWALILLFSFKQSEFTGFLALFLGTFGFLLRSYLESIDEISGGTVEALRATGASYFSIVIQAVVPMTITSIISWVLYMIEFNIRDATLVGMLTGSGIGFVFDYFFKSFRYHEAGLIIAFIVIAVITCESISNYVRRRII